MKISPKKLDSFIKNPPPDIVAFLVYGQDIGLIHETVLRIASSVLENLSDPFRVSELNGDEALKNPSKLIDEFTAQSLVGGKRIVRLQLTGQNISETLKYLFTLKNCDAILIIEAGNLKTTSPVRRLMEKEKGAVVVPCYQDNETELSNLISEVIQPHGLTISAAARNYLLNHLGSDRMVSRGELEKLVLYVGDKSEISLEDSENIVGDSSSLSIEKIVFSATSGNIRNVNTSFSIATIDGISPVALLRAAQIHMQRLLLTNAVCASGKTPREAIKMLRPPVLFFFEAEFLKQMSTWPPSDIHKALSLLTLAEIKCKTTGMPERYIGERAFMQLTQLARARQT